MVSNNSEHRATLRQWQLFILTVEKGSILAASAAANTDAAVVSREITKLEHLLQEPLLERSRSGVHPDIWQCLEANYEIKIFRLNIVDVLVTVDFDACVIRRLEFFKLCERLSDKPCQCPGNGKTDSRRSD